MLEQQSCLYSCERMQADKLTVSATTAVAAAALQAVDSNKQACTSIALPCAQLSHYFCNGL
jgi:hypothetical protein